MCTRLVSALFFDGGCKAVNKHEHFHIHILVVRKSSHVGCLRIIVHMFAVIFFGPHKVFTTKSDPGEPPELTPDCEGPHESTKPAVGIPMLGHSKIYCSNSLIPTSSQKSAKAPPKVIECGLSPTTSFTLWDIGTCLPRYAKNEWFDGYLTRSGTPRVIIQQG